MKIELAKLFHGQTALERLGNLSLGGLETYRLAKNIHLIKNELAPVEKTRMDMIARFDEKDEAWRGKAGMIAKFDREFNPVLDQEVEVELFTFSIAKLIKKGALPNDLATIWFMLEEPTSDEEFEEDEKDEEDDEERREKPRRRRK